MVKCLTCSREIAREGRFCFHCGGGHRIGRRSWAYRHIAATRATKTAAKLGAAAIV